MNDPTDAVVRGLSDRVRTLVSALDRQDRLETAGEFVGWLDGQISTGRLVEVTQEMLLRSLRVASDPINLGLLLRLDPLGAVSIGDLVRQSGLTRVAVSERVNDLVQVGLATREMIGDEVRSTSLSGGLLEVLADLSERSAALLADQLRAARPAARHPAADGPVADRNAAAPASPEDGGGS